MFNKEEHHNPKEPMQEILDRIHECLNVETVVYSDYIAVPKWNMTIRPEISSLEEKMAVLGFHVYTPDWDEPLYECCAATAKDSHTALGIALSQFIFCFMNGVTAMIKDEDPDSLESEFAGKKHRWSVYTSNSVGLGEDVGKINFWELLKDHIVKRLGNQNICYIKIYAAKCIGKNDQSITGEVRINDIPSKELSKIISELAEKWDVEQFAAQKQFFFLKQDPETLIPNRYSGSTGRADFALKVKKALESYSNIQTQEEYDKYCDNLADSLDDCVLAEEIIHFLPEIAAQEAFSEMQFPEQINISIDGKEPVTVYEDQLTDFHPLAKTLFSLLDSGVFGDKTNDIFSLLVNTSAIHNVVSQIKEKGKDISECEMSSLTFNPSADFEIR